MNNDLFTKIDNFLNNKVSLPKIDPNNIDDTYKYIEYRFYDRIYDGIKSCKILMENDRYFDTLIISGHLLETYSMFNFITNYKTEKNIKNYRKLMASIILYQISGNFDWKCIVKEFEVISYNSLLNTFIPYGDSIIKKDKNFNDIISKLKSFNVDNKKEIIEILEENFNPIKPEKYIQRLKDHNSQEKNMIQMLYNKYCYYKHCNLLNFEASFESNFEDDILIFITDMLNFIFNTNFQEIIE